ncbi:hypothetical protein C0J52_02389 [Blattella germanica]|nr:hypothetical protein C0J52_02389 [Blattella germanica]
MPTVHFGVRPRTQASNSISSANTTNSILFEQSSYLEQWQRLSKEQLVRCHAFSRPLNQSKPLPLQSMR